MDGPARPRPIRRIAFPAGLALAAVLAALIRLVPFGLVNFSRDDAWLLLGVRDWIAGGPLPLLGIGSSQGLGNGPIAVYLAGLAWRVAPAPESAFVLVALLHAAAVAALGWLVGRFFGAVAGLAAALLLAVHPWSVHYGRGLVLETFMPPFAVGYVACLYLAVVERRGAALPVAGFLAGVLPEIHLGGIALWPLLGLAVLSQRALWSARRIALTAALLAIPFTPRLIWNATNGWADLASMRAYAGGPARLTAAPWELLWDMTGSGGYGGTLGEAFERFVARGGLAPGAIDHVLHGAFLAGIAVCLAGLVWPDRLPRLGAVAPGRRGYLLLLIWLVLVPLLLTRQPLEVFPHYVYEGFPAPQALMGIGLAVPAAWLLGGRGHRAALVARLLPLTLLVAAVVFQLRSFAAFAATYAEGGTDGGYGPPLRLQQAAVDAAVARAGTRPVYLASDGDRPGVDGQATAGELLRGTRPAKLVAASQYLVFPAAGAGVYLLSPDLDPATPLPGLTDVPGAALARPADRRAFRLADGPPDPAVPRAGPFDAGEFQATAGPVRLIGQRAAGPWRAGAVQRLAVVWQPEEPQRRPYDLQLSVQLLDPAGRRIAQQDRLSYPATRWEAGETVLSFFDLPIPPDSPPGSYRLETILYRLDGLERLDWRDPAGQNAGPVLRSEVRIEG